MRIVKLGHHLVCVGLLLLGCASDKDNLGSPSDAASPLPDASADLPSTDGHVQAADTFDSVGLDLVKDVGADTGPADSGNRDLAVDVQSALDSASATDAVPPVVGFPCRNDDDCCTAVDGCMARTYLYSRAPGANPPPTFSVSTGGCLACIPSAIQLSCVSGQCFGERVSNYSGALFNGHCGHVDVPDAGVTVLFQIVDAATPTVATKTSWTCGG